MSDRVFYDAEANVISLDLSNSILSKEFLDQLVEDVREVASQLPEKLHAIMYWHKTVITEDMNSYLSGTFSALAEYVRSIHRYSSIEPLPFRIVETPIGRRVFNSGLRCKDAALAAILIEKEDQYLQDLVEEKAFIKAEKFCRLEISQENTSRFWLTQLAYVHFLNEEDSISHYKSIEVFEELVSRNEGDGNARFWLGYVLYILLDDKERCRSELNAVLQQNPQHPYANLVTAGFADNTLAENLVYLTKVLEVQPGNRRARQQLINTLNYLGRNDEAQSQYLEMLHNEIYVERNYGIMNEYVNDVFIGRNLL
jgi:tetratricopeptide (TPR) repeat protein